MPKPFFIIPRIGGIAYLNNPKAACSSVLLALSQMRRREGFQPPDHLLPEGSHPIHGFHPHYAHTEYFFSRWPLSYPPLPSSFIKFTFVRNPYARFYSFYKSKVLTGQAPVRYYERFGINQNCSFAECVRVITSVDPQDLEHHAAPQSLLICDNGELQVDFIGKVEEFSIDWQVIKDLTGFDLQLDKLNVIRAKNDAPVFDADSMDRIYRYYRDDFDLFDYDPNSIELSNAKLDYPEKAIFNIHHLSIELIDHLKQEMINSNERIRGLAAEYSYDPDKRELFFKHQEELFRELLLKSNAVLEEQIKDCSASQRYLKSKSTDIGHQINTIHECQSRQGKKFDDLDKKMDKLEGSNQFLLNVQKKLNQQKTESDAELKMLRNVLYSNILASYRRSRKNPWKIVCRFLRSPLLNELKLLRKSGLVDPHYYFETYPHAMSSGLSAAEHYIRYGAQEGKNPSARFNTLHYFASHPDIVHAGINPLVDFIVKK